MFSTDYSYVLCESFHETNWADWGQVVRTGGDPMMDPRFLSAVEQSMANQTRLWTLIVYDPQRRPVGTACLSTFRVDACALMAAPWRRLVAGIRRLWRGYLNFNLMLVGVPVSASQSRLRIAPDTDVPRVLDVVDEVARELVRRHRSYLVMFCDADEEEAQQWKHLTDLGYLQVDTLAVNELPARFRDYDEFCAALRSQYRWKIASSRRKFAESGLRTVWVTGAEGAAELYTDEVHRLYDAVLQRARSRMESLPAEFFRQIAWQFGAQARFLFVYQGERIVGFLCCLAGGDEYHVLFTGIDYAANKNSDLYFNIMFEGMDDGLRQGATRIFVGASSDGFKMRSGCVQTRRHMFIKARGLLQPLLRMFADVVFPPVEIIAPYSLYRRQLDDSQQPSIGDQVSDRRGP